LHITSITGQEKDLKQHWGDAEQNIKTYMLKTACWEIQQTHCRTKKEIGELHQSTDFSE